MRSLTIYYLFFVLLLLLSCDRSPLFVKCADCVIDEPKSAVVNITLDDRDAIDHNETIVRIYAGNLEDDILLSSFNATGLQMTYTATVNSKYTFTATYFLKNSSYTVVNSLFPRVKFDSNTCTDPCYFVYDKDVNLKLKYTTMLKSSD